MRHMVTMSKTAVLVGVLLGGMHVLAGTVVSAADPAPPASEGGTAATAEPPTGAGSGGAGKGRHPMRKACHDDVKKFCADVKPGEGRILQCLKQHAQEVSPACAEQMQSRGKRK